MLSASAGSISSRQILPTVGSPVVASGAKLAPESTLFQIDAPS